MAIDGSEWDAPDSKENAAAFGWDAPDSKENAAAFGFPGAGERGQASVPEGAGGERQRVRLARGSGCGDGRRGGPGRSAGEQSLARKLYRRLDEDWLLIADRKAFRMVRKGVAD